ncbi:TIGR03085 family metal-binding protein [Brachybacterium squillarum]|uniref:TIGR03085 family metal-binding protein n=1 Tax=Brachybacterium squillarum TaxID=661979 RepID=UPI000262969B|nr:TIGR03085 family metal-binding protein [Brachybacterium squillarum]
MTSAAHDRPDAPERAELADLLAELGPEAPTILPGWNALELLDHLLERERPSVHSLAQRLPGPLGRRSAEAVEARRDLPWEQKVEQLREGPGPRSAVARADAFTGGAELLIHLEDLRRAQDGWQPRGLSVEDQQRAWRATGLFAGMMLRTPAHITLVSPLGGRRIGRPGSEGSVRVHGEPLELLLWVSGRDEVASVEVLGNPEGLSALAGAHRGI